MGRKYKYTHVEAVKDWGRWEPSELWMAVFEEALEVCIKEGFVKKGTSVYELIDLYDHYFRLIRCFVFSFAFPKFEIPGFGDFYPKGREISRLLKEYLRRGYLVGELGRVVLYRMCDGLTRAGFSEKMRIIKSKIKKRYITYDRQFDFSRSTQFGTGSFDLGEEFYGKRSSRVPLGTADVKSAIYRARYGNIEAELFYQSERQRNNG